MNEQYIIKPSSSAAGAPSHLATAFPAHIDSAYAPELRSVPFVSCWICLDDVSANNGSLLVVPLPKLLREKETQGPSLKSEETALSSIADGRTIAACPAATASAADSSSGTVTAAVCQPGCRKRVGPGFAGGSTRVCRRPVTAADGAAPDAEIPPLCVSAVQWLADHQLRYAQYALRTAHSPFCLPRLISA